MRPEPMQLPLFPDQAILTRVRPAQRSTPSPISSAPSAGGATGTARHDHARGCPRRGSDEARRATRQGGARERGQAGTAVPASAGGTAISQSGQAGAVAEPPPLPRYRHPALHPGRRPERGSKRFRHQSGDVHQRSLPLRERGSKPWNAPLAATARSWITDPRFAAAMATRIIRLHAITASFACSN
jgi:hypothetical protein